MPEVSECEKNPIGLLTVFGIVVAAGIALDEFGMPELTIAAEFKRLRWNRSTAAALDASR
jgi:hypothetical protein